MFVYAERLHATLVEIIRIPSTSGHEEYLRGYLEHALTALGLETKIDEHGNLIGTLSGEGTPLLLNAHMDRVPPGLGHEPILRDGILYSNGATNLGADDAAGIAVILEALRRTIEQNQPHPPLVVVFTVEEETGLHGAHKFDAEGWNVHDGIVFDNAFEAGVVVSKGASYDAFDVRITGRTGHPGKDLTQTINALEIFRTAAYPLGSLAGDLTRINIGHVTAGNARNSIPGQTFIEGEIRSFEPVEVRQQHLRALQIAFEQAAERCGGQVEFSSPHCSGGYSVSPDEPLLLTYQAVLAQRGATLEMRPTFIGSDSAAFRAGQIRAFTVSTGVVNEHSTEEYVALAPLEQLVTDALYLLHLWRERN
jgi:tripeptide aminopeptidase